ncbi:NAD-dependent epimerase/dehydratase family protein [Leptospira idonii]|uniref:NAD-dependent epimerase/dehydratase family protein n=1 Tax=Leptospira idonii TaxID=1193500 RepID=A0A4R9LYR0_9LEPT|nr:NAD-dependent epimerase/dehydratase family protein [Leptospira idonii]TGN18751.1 NAD-dependent epimerase/dehydratase family protein [Leptospira idonii]
MKGKIRAIITGASGMVGEGVLHECLKSDSVESVLVVGRKHCGTTHPKLKEILIPDFKDISSLRENLKGYNACYFCLGVSSIGLTEEQYFDLSHRITLDFAKILSELNQETTFCYVSGSGTDSTEKGSVMWARVKGKTENDLMKLPLAQVFAFRPGYMQPTKGLKNTLKYYKYISWTYPFLKGIFPGFVSSLEEVGIAMIRATLQGYPKKIVEVKDIKVLAGS